MFAGFHGRGDAPKPLDLLLVVERVPAFADRLQLLEEGFASGDRLVRVRGKSVFVDDLLDPLSGVVSEDRLAQRDAVAVLALADRRGRLHRAVDAFLVQVDRAAVFFGHKLHELVALRGQVVQFAGADVVDSEAVLDALAELQVPKPERVLVAVFDDVLGFDERGEVAVDGSFRPVEFGRDLGEPGAVVLVKEVDDIERGRHGLNRSGDSVPAILSDAPRHKIVCISQAMRGFASFKRSRRSVPGYSSLAADRTSVVVVRVLPVDEVIPHTVALFG